MSTTTYTGTKVLKEQEGAYEEKGERAKLSNILGAIAISDLVKTTLGPKGMDKILISKERYQKIEVTNDGATILKAITVDNPAAKVLINISKTQDEEVGDGTTSVCVLAGELLREADKLLQQKIHPQTIIEGWRLAVEVARKALENSTKNHKDDKKAFYDDLFNIACTTLGSKILQQNKEHFAKLAVDAVLRLEGSGDLEQIQIIKKSGGLMKDSFLDEGFILEKRFGQGQVNRVENAKVLLANTAMDYDKVKIYGGKVQTNSIEQLAKIEEQEKQKMRDKVKKILDHGCNVFINRQLIYNYPEELFAEAGISSIEHADFEGIESLALVLDGDIVSTFETPKLVKLGHCKLIEEIMIGEEKMLRFSGCASGKACTIVLRGASKSLLDEASRSLHDALCVLTQTVKETRTVLGGGCSEMLMAKAVQEVAKLTPGKKALAMESFARALKQIPTIISDNAGLDSAELVSTLEAEHFKGNSTYGIDIVTGGLGDVQQLKITESFKVKLQVLLSASEAAEMILRVDRKSVV